MLWIARLWVRIHGGSEPPLSPAVWLQADDRVWKPQSGAHVVLWHTLRVAMLSAAWSWRLRRAASGEQFAPGQIISTCIADIRRLVRADWETVVSSCTDMAGTHRSWFPGREPWLAVEEFEKRWCGGGVIASVVRGAAGQKPRMEFRLGVEAASVAAARRDGGAAQGTARASGCPGHCEPAPD